MVLFKYQLAHENSINVLLVACASDVYTNTAYTLFSCTLTLAHEGNICALFLCEKRCTGTTGWTRSRTPTTLKCQHCPENLKLIFNVVFIYLNHQKIVSDYHYLITNYIEKEYSDHQ